MLTFGCYVTYHYHKDQANWFQAQEFYSNRFLDTQFKRIGKFCVIEVHNISNKPHMACNQKSAMGRRAVFGGLGAPPEAIGGLEAEPPALEKFSFCNTKLILGFF